MKRMKYEDWLLRDAVSPLELALLMADTCPDSPLGEDILKVATTSDPSAYGLFAQTYAEIPSQWYFYEKFERCRELVFRAQRSGALGGKRHTTMIAMGTAITFVAQFSDQKMDEGDTYRAFLRAAIEMEDTQQSSNRRTDHLVDKREAVSSGRGDLMTTQKHREIWWHEHARELSRSISEKWKEKKENLHPDGTVIQLKLATEISKRITSIARRNGTRRDVEIATVRAFLPKVKSEIC